jgi:hypothetical protein
MLRILLPSLLLTVSSIVAETPTGAKLEDAWSKPPVISPILQLPEGQSQKTDGSVQAWQPKSPSDYSGRYRLYGITDGHGWIDVKVTKLTSSPDSDPWRVEATLVTEWTKEIGSTLHFKGAFLERDTPLPYFEVGRRHFIGYFVEFTDKTEGETHKPQKAIIIGDDVFVRDDNYKPRSY